MSQELPAVSDDLHDKDYLILYRGFGLDLLRILQRVYVHLEASLGAPLPPHDLKFPELMAFEGMVAFFSIVRYKDRLPSGFQCNVFLIDEPLSSPVSLNIWCNMFAPYVAPRCAEIRARIINEDLPPSLQKDQHPRPVHLLSLLSTSYCATIGADFITESLPSPFPSPNGVDAMCQRA
ncbi:hypothetical protein B0H11DRAFT_2250135 [Mycena galericulata]|nr:hypothetical protein B0H11DRAFT_2250135 [Mycena galericulata]